MGDTATNICDHETSIMLALSSFILERSALILEISHCICQLDCLLALATVAKENDWCRPHLTQDHTSLVIKVKHYRILCIFPVKTTKYSGSFWCPFSISWMHNVSVIFRSNFDEMDLKMDLKRTWKMDLKVKFKWTWNGPDIDLKWT